MLRDEPLEVIREQYEEKNMVLEQYGEQVSPWALYEDIFDDLEQEIPVVFIDDDEEKRIRKMSISDAITMGTARNDTLIGGCTYFNSWISKKSARNIYTFIIDYDNAYSGPLLRAFQHGWKTESGDPVAMPTYIVNSGTGLHLYFVLEEPIPCYHSMTKNLDAVYRALAIQQSRRVFVELQIQWFGQDFRCAGGLNKYEWENTIFKVGDKWNIDDLAKAVGVDVHFTRYGEKRKKQITGGKTQPKKRKYPGWQTNRAFYDYSLERCRNETREGNRYLSMCALSAIAFKCGVTKSELERDLLGLLPAYNKGATRPVKEKEVISAVKMYNDRAMLAPRDSLERWQGWTYTPIKRKGQKRDEHLEEARAIRDIRQRRKGRKWTDGNGRKSKKDIVEEWQQENPGRRKADCIRDLGIDRKTVAKYWQKATPKPSDHENE